MSTIDIAKQVETSHQTGMLALSLLKELGLAATPRNYETWCTHIQGEVPALSRDMQKFLHIDGKITQEEADTLYHLHIARADLAHDVSELATSLQVEMNELFQHIEAQNESSHEHSATLGDLTAQLDHSSTDNTSVKSLLESAINITKKMRAENQELESSLAASTNEISSLRRNVESIQKEAMSDPLTGINNRKSFDRNIARLIDESQNTTNPLTLIMADVDHFKSFNDRWGHQTGDQVLRLVAEVMNANIKGQDLLARYGGEEFSILLPGTTIENGHMLADRIRRAVESRRLKKRQSNEDLGVVTMSMGVAHYHPGDNVAALIERADKSLYLAKERGRNCVIDEREFADGEKSVDAVVA